MCLCEGRIQCIPQPTPDNYSKYQNKEEYIHIQLFYKKEIKRLKKREEKI